MWEVETFQEEKKLIGNFLIDILKFRKNIQVLEFRIEQIRQFFEYKQFTYVH